MEIIDDLEQDEEFQRKLEEGTDESDHLKKEITRSMRRSYKVTQTSCREGLVKSGRKW